MRWLITVARSRFLDLARREQHRSKLALIRPDGWTADEPTGTDVLDCLVELRPLHRAVLVMRYVDGLAVADIADVLGRRVPATNSLLARARAELRRSERRRSELGRSEPGRSEPRFTGGKPDA